MSDLHNTITLHCILSLQCLCVKLWHGVAFQHELRTGFFTFSRLCSGSYVYLYPYRFPEMRFFQEDDVRTKLTDILFCYARENEQLLYKQVLSFFFFFLDFFPQYKSCPVPTYQMILSLVTWHLQPGRARAIACFLWGTWKPVGTYFWFLLQV